MTLAFNVTRNVAQYPLHHVTHAAPKFEVATSNAGDTFTKKTMTHGRTDARTDVCTKLVKKSGYKNKLTFYRNLSNKFRGFKTNSLFSCTVYI